MIVNKYKLYLKCQKFLKTLRGKFPYQENIAMQANIHKRFHIFQLLSKL